MLDPKKNWIDYGEQLIPPEGYNLSQAIGTTYSLDLEAFMLLPVALYYASRIDGQAEDLRPDVVEALTKASDKITVFYQKEHLKVLHKYHPLIAFCEHRIVPIHMPSHQQSFHPKVWVARYERKAEKPIYRLLITSRNLTFDRSWDMAFSTMGYVTDRQQRINEPLTDFISYLFQSSSRSVDQDFLSDLATVDWEKPDGFNRMQFMPVGINRMEKKYLNPISSNKWDALLIMSPFLDLPTLKTLRSNCAMDPYLLSTKEAMDGIQERLLGEFGCRQFYDYFEKAEFYQELEEDGFEPQAQKLHAKFFVGERGQQCTWHIGSANCTDPAQARNIEFMVALTTSNVSPYRVKDVFKQMTDAKKADGITLFVEYDYERRVDQGEKENQDLIIRKIKHDIASLSLNGQIVPSKKDKAYDLSIEIDTTDLIIPDGFSIMIRPIAETNKKPVIVSIGSMFITNAFGDYQETHLSPFIEFSIYKGKELLSRFLLFMTIELPGSRLGRIMTSIIDSQEKFMKYLAFLLTGEVNGVLKSKQESKGIRIPSDQLLGFANGIPIFEKLLITCSRQPEKLKEVDNLIRLLMKEEENSDEVIITPEFESFWSVFRTYMTQDETSR